MKTEHFIFTLPTLLLLKSWLWGRLKKIKRKLLDTGNGMYMLMTFLGKALAFHYSVYFIGFRYPACLIRVKISHFFVSLNYVTTCICCLSIGSQTKLNSLECLKDKARKRSTVEMKMLGPPTDWVGVWLVSTSWRCLQLAPPPFCQLIFDSPKPHLRWKNCTKRKYLKVKFVNFD